MNHRAAIVEAKQVGALLRAIEGYEGAFSVRLAFRLLARTIDLPRLGLRHGPI